LSAERGAQLPELPCACASLRRAARAVTQLYDAELRATGLRSTQLTLLQVLARSGGLAQGALGELLATDSTTLSRTLRPLADEGWIRGRPGEDRRVVIWTITDAGRKQLASAEPAWRAVQRALRARLGQERWDAMLSELATVAQAAAAAR
jgi:DNA-binding MarR family transcriptional regulator